MDINWYDVGALSAGRNVGKPAVMVRKNAKPKLLQMEALSMMRRG